MLYILTGIISTYSLLKGFFSMVKDVDSLKTEYEKRYTIKGHRKSKTVKVDPDRYRKMVEYYNDSNNERF